MCKILMSIHAVTLEKPRGPRPSEMEPSIFILMEIQKTLAKLFQSTFIAEITYTKPSARVSSIKTTTKLLEFT